MKTEIAYFPIHFKQMTQAMKKEAISKKFYKLNSSALQIKSDTEFCKLLEPINFLNS